MHDSTFLISSFIRRRLCVFHLRNVEAVGARVLRRFGCTALCFSVSRQSCLLVRLGLCGGRLLLLVLLLNATVPRQNTMYITICPSPIIERTSQKEMVASGLHKLDEFRLLSSR